MSTSRTILGVDLGGTKLAVGRLDEHLSVLQKTVTPTVTQDSQACLDDLFARLDGILAGGGADAIGVGTASMVDFAGGRIVESTNLPLADVALRDELQARYGVPVVVDNDANVACIAEHAYGAGVGINEMLMLTIGTGIGGGIICNGRPYRGFSGAAGELGHMVIDVNGPRCQGSCPGYGCLEAFVSGGALARHARRLAAAQPGSSSSFRPCGVASLFSVTTQVLLRSVVESSHCPTMSFLSVEASCAWARDEQAMSAASAASAMPVRGVISGSSPGFPRPASAAACRQTRLSNCRPPADPWRCG